MEIKMKLCAAYPGGVYLPGRKYRSPHALSDEMASAFIGAGAATACPEDGLVQEVAVLDVAVTPEEAIEETIEERHVPEIYYKSGWFYVDGEPMRQKELPDKWLEIAANAKEKPGVIFDIGS